MRGPSVARLDDDSTSALPGSGRDAMLHDCQPYGLFGTP